MKETTDAATILAPLWKRKWLILIVGVLVAGATYAYYKRQPAVFTASTQLDLGSGNEAQQLNTGKSAVTSRTLADAASLITSSVVAEAVHARLAREGVKNSASRKSVQAKTSQSSDFLTITTEAASAKAAARLANDYAEAYIERQRAGYVHQVKAAIANTRRQLRRIEAAQAAASSSSTTVTSTTKGKGTTRAAGKSSVGAGATVIQAASLASKINQLESQLSVTNAQQVNPAKPKSAVMIEPTPKKNAIFGFVLGILLAGIAAFVLSRLDRRIGSLGLIEPAFNAQILAALPRVKSPLIHDDGQPRPAAPLLEPLRGLHTTLEIGDTLGPERGSSARLILFVSADAGDGKSTLIADLALVQRDAGARVAVIDADLRRSVQAKLLAVEAKTGLAEVLAGAASFDEAMQSAGSSAAVANGAAATTGSGVSTLVQAHSTGSLSVLPGGGPAANPPALLAGQAMQELLRSAAGEYDYVLIDAPPPLEVSDAMPLLRSVDAIVIVARMEHTRAVSAERLTQLLARTSTAPVIGVVANAVSASDLKQHGFTSVYGGRRSPRKLFAR